VGLSKRTWIAPTGANYAVLVTYDEDTRQYEVLGLSQYIAEMPERTSHYRAVPRNTELFETISRQFINHLKLEQDRP
jgi:hypothetical protein